MFSKLSCPKIVREINSRFVVPPSQLGTKGGMPAPQAVFPRIQTTLLLVFFLGLMNSPLRCTSAQQHPNYNLTPGYLDVLHAISLLEKETARIDESTKTKLLAEGALLKRLEKSYANGSQPSIKRYAAAEKKSEDLEIEFKRLSAAQKQLAANSKRTQLQVDTFNAWQKDYNTRATNHNRMFNQLVVYVNAENKRLEARYAAFVSRVKSYTNPPAAKISSTINNMVAGKKYEADASGTKCNHFVNDYAKSVYNYDGFETKNSDGTTQPRLANTIIKKMQDEPAWKNIYDDPKWENTKLPFLQAAFKKAAQYAADGDLVIVGFRTGTPEAPDAHLAIVQKGELANDSATWSQAGMAGLEFPRIGQAGTEVFAGKSLSLGFTPDDLKKYGLVIYVLKP
jgi:hypothetical protein